MRILVVSSWWPYPPDNGSRMRAFHLLQELSHQHALTLVAAATPGQVGSVEALRGVCERVEAVAPVTLEGGRLTVRGLFSPVPRHFVQTENRELRRVVQALATGHDAALALQIDAARYLAEAAPELPSVFDEVEVGVLRDQYAGERQLLPRWRHGLTWLKLRRYVRSLTARFAYVTVVSEQERRYLVEAGCDPGRIVVVPNGVAIGPPRAAAPRANRVIYPGSVTYSANHDAVRYFVGEVFPRLRRLRPDLTFCVTGSTEGVDLGGLAGVEGVIFTGYLDDVALAIAESAACVVPLRKGGGTRLKVLEAMAVGTPVVSTSKGIEGLDLEPERHLLVGDDPESLASQVLRLLDDAPLARKLAAAARTLVEEKYAWGLIAQTLEETIVRAHGERGRQPRGRS